MLRNRPFVRRGDVSNWLTSEAFDLEGTRSIEAEAAIRKAKALLTRSPTPNLNDFKAADALRLRPGQPLDVTIK